MSSTDVLIDANENIRMLAQRLGWLIPKFNDVDHKEVGIGKWLLEYESIKSTALKAMNMIKHIETLLILPLQGSIRLNSTL